MGSTSVITPEDVLESLMNDGTIDSLRLKIINQLKANEELKRTTIKMAEQSRVLNTPGAEKQTKRELFDALRRELESQVLEKASKSVWELILDNNGMGKEINQTVERVFCKLSGREPPLFPPQPDPNAKKSKANANVKAGESGNVNAKVKANASAKGKGKVVAKGKAKVKGKVKEKVREATSEKKEEEKSNSKKRSYSEVNAQTEGRGGGDGETGVVAMVEDTQVSKVVGLEEQQVEAKPEETSVVAMAEDPQV